MSKKTPEQRSLDRYPEDAPPYGVVYPNEHKRYGYATCIREEAVPLEEEFERINAVLNHRAMNLTASEAVKWLHNEYTAMCVPLQECCQKHKLGFGGENVAKVAVEAIEQKTAENAKLRGLVRELGVYALGASDALWNTQNMSASPPLPSEVIQEYAASGESLYQKSLATAKQDGLAPTNTEAL